MDLRVCAILFYADMDITQENIDELNAVVKIKIGPEDYKEQYEKSLKKYRSQLNLPGFRNGKVPIGVIKKKYGPSVLAEEINKVLSSSLQSHIRENKLEVLGNPLPKENEAEQYDWHNPSDFEFSYEIGLAPNFEIKLSKREKHKYVKLKVDDELIDKQVEDFARRYGKLTQGEVAEERDMILGLFAELAEDGSEKEGGIRHSSTVSIEYIQDEKIKKSFIGKKVGDTVENLDPKSVSRGAADMGAMLGIPKEEAERLESSFNFTFTEIKQMQPAETNQELFDKIYGEGNINSEEEFRDRISKELEVSFEKDSDRLFKRDFSKKMTEKLGMNLPDEFLKKWIMASNEKEISREEVDKEYDDYADSLKWQLIEKKLIEENELQVDEEEVLGFAKGLIANNYAQYNMPIPEEDELTKSALKVLKSQDEAKRIFDMLYDQKLIAFLKETIKLDEEQVSYDDFLKLAYEK